MQEAWGNINEKEVIGNKSHQEVIIARIGLQY